MSTTLLRGQMRSAKISAALDDKGIDYEIADVSQDPAALEMVKELGYLQAPVVITDEDHWSGFRPDKIDELAKRLS